MKVLSIALVVLLALSAAPAAAQSAPNGERTVTTTGGNTVTVEKVVENEKVVRVRITVTSPDGRVIARADVSYDPQTGSAVKGEAHVKASAAEVQAIVDVLRQFGVDPGDAASVSGSTEVRLELKVENGRVTKVEQKSILVENGQTVEIERKFLLQNGVLTLVKEERKVRGPEGAGDDDGDEAVENDSGKKAGGQKAGPSAGNGGEEHRSRRGEREDKEEEHHKEGED